jgi:hypothetical protein
VSGPADFAAELNRLGHSAVAHEDGRVTLQYAVPLGTHRGQEVSLGFRVPADFPGTPPGGPCLAPRLGHPQGNVHAADDFGAEWEYWSRPYAEWAVGPRTAKAYMAHVRRLFAQQ